MSSNYPPGVTGAMIDRFFAEPPLPPRCPKCKAWVPFRGDKEEPWEEKMECSGQPLFPEEKDPYCVCGSFGPHEPHAEVMAAGWNVTRTCKRCDHTWTESVI